MSTPPSRCNVKTVWKLIYKHFENQWGINSELIPEMQLSGVLVYNFPWSVQNFTVYMYRVGPICRHLLTCRIARDLTWSCPLLGFLTASASGALSVNSKTVTTNSNRSQSLSDTYHTLFLLPS